MSSIIERVDQTTIYTQPVFFVLILVTNTFNICILRSPALRSSPCTYYFFSYSIFSIVYMTSLCPLQMLRHYSIPWTNTSLGCRVQDFLLFTLALQTKLMLTLASFDRFCASSMSVRLRSFSKLKTARVAIIVGAFSSLLYMSPMTAIEHYNRHRNTCDQHLNKMTLFYMFGQGVLYFICIPTLMVAFGLLTIYNIRQKASITLTIVAYTRTRRSEGQLARMLLLQVGAHLIYTLPFGVTHMMRLYEPFRKLPILSALNQASIPWFQCDYFTFFFLYILSARVYRLEFFRLLKISTRPHQTQRWTHQKQLNNSHWVSTAGQAIDDSLVWFDHCVL